MKSGDVGPRPWGQIGQHALFYFGSIGLGLLTAAAFLLNRDAGPEWAKVGLPLDDTWIHLVYARSLAQLGWFYYNPGAAEAGMSSPLWVLLLAVPLRAGLDPVLSAKGLSLMFGLATPLVVYHLCLQGSKSRMAAVLAGCLLAIEPNFAFAKVSGMETALLAFLLSLAAWLLLRKSYLGFGTALGIAVITRGEAAVFGIVVGAILLLRQYTERRDLQMLTRTELSLALKLFLPALVLGGAWALYNFSVSGRLLPNTYYVKHYFGLGLLNPVSLLGIWMGYLRHAALTYRWLALPSTLLTLLGMHQIARQHRVHSTALIVAPWLFIYTLSLNFLLASAAWNFAGRRHLDFIWPFVAASLAIGAVRFWKGAAASGRRWIILIVPLASLAYAAALLRIGLDRFRSLASEYSWNCRNIEEVSVAVSKWVAAHIEEGARVGVTDAGAIRFFGEHEVIDFQGLNLHPAIGRRLDELILEYEPEYAVLFRSEEIDSWDFLDEIFSAKPERNTILGGNELVVYRYLPDP